MKFREIRHNLWNIGFIEDGLETTLCRKNLQIHWVKKRIKDRWFADPFILDVNDKAVIILAEEYCYNVKRGRIARLEIDRHSYEEIAYEIVLDLPTHLSFPFIYRLGDNVYVIPENSASGFSTIYKYDDASRQMTPIHRLADEPFTDAVIFNIKDQSYLYTTKLPEANSSAVEIYSFDENSLRVNEKLGSFEFPVSCGRNAGAVFSVNGHLYRPAQDCTLCYGHGVILQKVTFDHGEWSFEDVNSIYPTTFRYNQGVHTFNSYKGLIVIDARGYRNPILGRISTALLKLLGKK